VRKLGTSRQRLEHPWNKTLGFRGVFQCLPEVKAIESSTFLERAMGIEPIAIFGSINQIMLIRLPLLP
jgi:hypothetical protein